LGKWETIGIDCVAMNVNDVICVGAEPIAMVDYLVLPAPDAELTTKIAAGLSEGARQSNISIIGGETASLPDLVNGFDLAGTCMGVVKRDQVLDGRGVQEGDVILGLPSHGVHSNGYTLIRKLVAKNRLSWKAKAPFARGASLGEALLEPTKIYVKPALRLLQSGLAVKAFAHVTGGGLQNLPRMNRGFRYVVEDPLEPQPVFAWLREVGGFDPVEMYKTFNMGMGFAVVARPQAAARGHHAEPSVAHRPRRLARSPDDGRAGRRSHAGPGPAARSAERGRSPARARCGRPAARSAVRSVGHDSGGGAQSACAR
jgi:phosphoribosylformylglycinamidine cyclo-ligase